LEYTERMQRHGTYAVAGAAAALAVLVGGTLPSHGQLGFIEDSERRIGARVHPDTLSPKALDRVEYDLEHVARLLLEREAGWGVIPGSEEAPRETDRIGGERGADRSVADAAAAARAAMEEGSYYLASEHWKSVVQALPDSGAAWVGFGGCLLRANLPYGAEHALARARRWVPDALGLRYNECCLWAVTGESDRLAETAQTFNIGELAQVLGWFGPELEGLETIMNEDQLRRLSLVFLTGLLEAEPGEDPLPSSVQGPRAASWSRRILALRERLLRAVRMVHAADWDGAAIEFTAAVESGLTHPQVRLALAYAMYKQGRAGEALGLLARTARAFPERPELVAHYVSIRYAEDRDAAAVDRILSLYEREPEHRDVVDAYVEMRIGQQQFDRALEALDRVRRAGKETVYAMLLRAVALRGLGREDEALESVRAARRRGPNAVPFLLRASDWLSSLEPLLRSTSEEK
jgi:tetratricopeptide (TPR) repeat protein